MTHRGGIGQILTINSSWSTKATSKFSIQLLTLEPPRRQVFDSISHPSLHSKDIWPDHFDTCNCVACLLLADTWCDDPEYVGMTVSVGK